MHCAVWWSQARAEAVKATLDMQGREHLPPVCLAEGRLLFPCPPAPTTHRHTGPATLIPVAWLVACGSVTCELLRRLASSLYMCVCVCERERERECVSLHTVSDLSASDDCACVCVCKHGKRVIFYTHCQIYQPQCVCVRGCV